MNPQLNDAMDLVYKSDYYSWIEFQKILVGSTYFAHKKFFDEHALRLLNSDDSYLTINTACAYYGYCKKAVTYIVDKTLTNCANSLVVMFISKHWPFNEQYEIDSYQGDVEIDQRFSDVYPVPVCKQCQTEFSNSAVVRHLHCDSSNKDNKQLYSFLSEESFKQYQKYLEDQEEQEKNIEEYEKAGSDGADLQFE